MIHAPLWLGSDVQMNQFLRTQKGIPSIIDKIHFATWMSIDQQGKASYSWPIKRRLLTKKPDQLGIAEQNESPRSWMTSKLTIISHLHLTTMETYLSNFHFILLGPHDIFLLSLANS